MPGVLEGVRVLDFGRFIAAPYCAALLSDLGAEVIRVEKVGGGDDRFLTPVSATGDGAFIVALGRNKKGITLNPRKEEGRLLMKKLIGSADVVIANMPVSGLQAAGLDYDSLKQVKPDIILTTVSAYGTLGPYAERVGFDGSAQALCGGIHLSGENGLPRKSAIPYCDYGTASLAAFSTLAAILHRQKTGEGQWVETSLLATALAYNNTMLAEEHELELNRPGAGNQSQGAAPADIFQVRDGAVLVQVLGEPIFKRWSALLGVEHLQRDPRFATDQSRGDNREVLNKIMRGWCCGMTRRELLDALNKARIPCEEVLPLNRVLTHPQVAEGEFFDYLDWPGLRKPVPVAKAPFRMNGLSLPVVRRAPLLGEHTHELLTELGYTGSELERLCELGVI